MKGASVNIRASAPRASRGDLLENGRPRSRRRNDWPGLARIVHPPVLTPDRQRYRIVVALIVDDDVQLPDSGKSSAEGDLDVSASGELRDPAGVALAQCPLERVDECSQIPRRTFPPGRSRRTVPAPRPRAPQGPGRQCSATDPRVAWRIKMEPQTGRIRGNGSRPRGHSCRPSKVAQFPEQINPPAARPTHGSIARRRHGKRALTCRAAT